MGVIDLGKVRGTTIYSGGKITGSSAAGVVFSASGIAKAYEGDLYINTNTSGDYPGYVYECIESGDADTATWSYKGSIRGPKSSLVNSLESTSTEDGLAAYQGKRLLDMITGAGIFCRSVITECNTRVYSAKVTVDNVDTTITLVVDGTEYTYSYSASGTVEKITRSIYGIANSSGGVVSEIRSSDANIYSYSLLDSSTTVVHSETLDIWDSINEAAQSHDVTGSIVDGTETMSIGNIYKFLSKVKKVFYPITHAKAVWFDKANNKTVHDVLAEMKEKYPDGIIPIANGGTGATTAEDALTKLGAVSKKFIPQYATTNKIFPDALYADFSSPFGTDNEVGYVVAGSTEHLPTGCAFGIRELYWYNSTHNIVKITGITTTNSLNVWYAFYNGTWNGWYNTSFESRDIGSSSVDDLYGDSFQGRYFINGSTAAGTHPTTDYYTLIAFTSAQLALPYSGGGIYYRTFANSVWTAWRTAGEPVEATYTPLNGTVSNADVFESNGIVYFSVNTNHSSILGAGTYSQIGTLSKKPAKTIVIPCLYNLADSGLIQIDTSGNVKLCPRNSVNYTSGSAIVFNGQYRCQK